MKTILRSTWVLLAAGALLIAWDLGVRAAPAAPGVERELRAAERLARGFFESAAERRIEARQELE